MHPTPRSAGILPACLKPAGRMPALLFLGVCVCAAAPAFGQGNDLEQRKAAGRNAQFPADKGYTGDLTLLAGEPQARATREAFLTLIKKQRVPAAAESKELGESEGVKQVHFSFATEPGQRATGLWYQRAHASGPRPVVILLHGTGGNKEGMKEHLVRYAQAGFVALALDARYHGERSASGKGKADYEAAIVRAWRTPGREYPFFFDTVWEVMRLIDYLETRPDVDPKRIGLTGISKGGIETYLTAAVDPRVAVAVPCIGVQSFGWAVQNDSWQSRIESIQAAADAAAKEAGVAKIDAAFVQKFYARVAPGIDGQFDGPAMLPLIAPRPLLVINGDRDPRTPMTGLLQCIDAARARYREADALERFAFVAQPDTAHKVTPEGHAQALEWFKRWLKP